MEEFQEKLKRWKAEDKTSGLGRYTQAYHVGYERGAMRAAAELTSEIQSLKELIQDIKDKVDYLYKRGA